MGASCCSLFVEAGEKAEEEEPEAQGEEGAEEERGSRRTRGRESGASTCSSSRCIRDSRHTLFVEAGEEADEGQAEEESREGEKRVAGGEVNTRRTAMGSNDAEPSELDRRVNDGTEPAARTTSLLPGIIDGMLARDLRPRHPCPPHPRPHRLTIHDAAFTVDLIHDAAFTPLIFFIRLARDWIWRFRSASPPSLLLQLLPSLLRTISRA
ncbi:hypothetical protein C8R45DRAFT_1102106 [Mycena sanguinolenta]|nr:hypothetical protein C8R45DRAFT_1102106 [Mycena sanguinolenta]